MCGIVAATAQRDVSEILISGLRALEYRGYDSAGISIQNNGTLGRLRTEGKVRNLEALLDDYNEKSRGIWSQSQEAYRDLRMEFRQELRGFLNPEQQKRFDELMAEHDNRCRKDNTHNTKGR